MIYSKTDSRMTMITILHTMDMELMALDRPTSSPRSPVKAGTMAEMGLNSRITRVLRTSWSKGSRKNTPAAIRADRP